MPSRFLLLLLFSLLSAACIIGEDPDFDPGTEGDTGGEPEEGELWCSWAEGAEVWHNGRAVPPAFGGPWVKDEADHWVTGCGCVDGFDSFALHFYDGQSDGQFDGWVIIGDDHLYTDLRDEIHAQTVLNCAKRAFEMAEAFFCANFCGEPFNYDWEDFAALTEHTCAEVVIDDTPLHAFEGDLCYVGEDNPQPEN